MPAKRETYTCPNGPNLAVVYSGDGATLSFSSGRVEVLPATEKEDVYARPGIAWNASDFRRARLDDEGKSYLCDQMAG